MSLSRFLQETINRPAQREEDLLDRHATLLLAGSTEEAVALRRQQARDVAALMLVAEQLSRALKPVTLSEAAREWLRLRAFGEAVPRSAGRFAAAMRGHGREAVFGAALVGTAALGTVAYRSRRKRGEGVPTIVP